MSSTCSGYLTVEASTERVHLETGDTVPRRREKTRVERLAQALEKALAVQAELNEINLRSTGGELRESLKAARRDIEQTISDLGEALKLDVPAPAAPARAAGRLAHSGR